MVLNRPFEIMMKTAMDWPTCIIFTTRDRGLGSLTYLTTNPQTGVCGPLLAHVPEILVPRVFRNGLGKRILPRMKRILQLLTRKKDILR